MNRIACVLAFAAFLLPASASAQTKNIVLSEVAASNIGFLFDNLKVEFAFCAYGHKEADTIYVDRITLPIIYNADRNGVEHKRCHGRGFVGDGHGHYDPEDCDLSRVDRGSAIVSNLKYTILICTAGRYKLFSKREIEDSFTKEELADIRDAAKFLTNHSGR